MSNADRTKWNARYREGAYADRPHPTALLAQWLPAIPRGRALDVACGRGRNALHLAEAGFEVDAVDISSVALEYAREAAAQRGLDVRFIQSDLDRDDALPNPSYDLVVLVRYVNAALMPRLIERLATGGFLICEQHLITTESVAGPANPAFRVPPGSLLLSASGLSVDFYREGLLEDPDGRTVALAQIVAHRPR